MPKLGEQYEGTFLARPVQVNICEGKEGSQSTGLYIGFEIHSSYNPVTREFQHAEKWPKGRDADGKPLGYIVEGRFWFIGRTGDILTDQYERLRSALGWSGKLSEIPTADFSNILVQITTKNEDYNGKRTLKAAWINRADAPVGGGGINDEKLAALEAKFGSQLEALAAKPVAPPVAAPAPTPAAAAPVSTLSQDPIPF